MLQRLTTNDDYLILDGAVVTGDVTLGRDVSVWFNAVVRGDTNTVTIGARSNVQDCCVLHTDETHPISIGEDVTIGHGAVVHGCTIGNRVLVGMGSVILSGAKIGDDCLIGAGALVTGKADIPSGSLVMGSPARVVRPMSEQDRALVMQDVSNYLALSRRYRVEGSDE